MAKRSYVLVDSPMILSIEVKYKSGQITWQQASNALSIAGIPVKCKKHYKAEWDKNIS